jgi:hypothetical protein
MPPNDLHSGHNIEDPIMKSFVRNALLGAAGLVALSLSAHAAGSTAVGDTQLIKSPTSVTKPMQMAQRPYDPSAGSVGFKKSKKKKAKKAKK